MAVENNNMETLRSAQDHERIETQKITEFLSKEENKSELGHALEIRTDAFRADFSELIHEMLPDIVVDEDMQSFLQQMQVAY